MNVVAVFTVLCLIGIDTAYSLCTDCGHSLSGVGFERHPYCRAYVRCEEYPYHKFDRFNYHFMCCPVGEMWSQELLTCIRGTKQDGCSDDPGTFVCPDIAEINANGPCPPRSYFTECAPGTAFDEDVCACDHIYGYLAPECTRLIHFDFDDDFHSRSCNNFVHGEAHGYPDLVDGALLLDGERDFIEFHFLNNWFVENPAALKMTFAAWIKPASGSFYDYFIVTNGDCYTMPTYTLKIDDSLMANFGASSASAPSDFDKYDQWSHVTAVYDGTSVELYMNCVNVASEPAVGPIPNAQTFNLIGYYGEFYKGFIDDVMVWSEALTPAEVADLCVVGRTD